MRTKRSQFWMSLMFCTSLMLSWRAAAWAQGADTVTKGKVLYHTHCASCHRESAQGDGWVGQALRTPPTDLTQLARKNSGTFSDAAVAEFIDGQRDVLAHGQRSMPVWGLNFQNQALIEAIVAYLRTLQQL